MSVPQGASALRCLNKQFAHPRCGGRGAPGPCGQSKACAAAQSPTKSHMSTDSNTRSELFECYGLHCPRPPHPRTWAAGDKELGYGGFGWDETWSSEWRGWVGSSGSKSRERSSLRTMTTMIGRRGAPASSGRRSLATANRQLWRSADYCPGRRRFAAIKLCVGNSAQILRNAQLPLPGRLQSRIERAARTGWRSSSLGGR